MNRWVIVLAATLGCPSTSEPDPVPDPPAWCDDGRAAYDWDPRRSAPLRTFPDDHFLRPDPSRPTGQRVHLEADQNEALLAELPPSWLPTFDALSTLDGWGLTAGVVFRFVFSLDPTTVTEDAVAIVAFEPSGPVRYGVDIELTEFPDTVILRPQRPLPPATQAVALLLTSVRSSDGSCVRQPTALRQRLSPSTELPAGVSPHVLAPRFAAGLAALALAPADVVAMTVFTTQSTPLQSVAVAERVRAGTYEAQAPFGCSALDGARSICEGAVSVLDFRGVDGVVPALSSPEPLGTYDLPVTVWLPGPLASGPYPVALFGHGLVSGRGEGAGVAAELAQLGIAVVATDALEHGAHPRRTAPEDEALQALRFFGIRSDPMTIDGLLLRDHLRQGSWDRLQVVEAVRDGLDLDGDGGADLVPDGLLCVGGSLGGIMGTETMALSDAFAGGALFLAGGRLTSVVLDSPRYAPLVDLLSPDGWTDDDVLRFVPAVQTLVDGGDPMVWARYLVGERLVGSAATPPQVLSMYAFNDAVIPNRANAHHAAGLRLMGVGRALWPMPPVVFGPGPLVGNLRDGGTAGIVLFDVVTAQEPADAAPEPVTHDTLEWSREGRSVWLPFLAAVAAGEPGVIVDPYADE